jgi:hypothetical protein
MKKNILLFVCLVAVSVCNAQQGFNIGISGSINSTFIWRQNNYGTLAPFGDPEVRRSEMNYRFTLGGNGGLELGYNVTHNWGVQIMVQYATGGQNYEDNFIGPATIPEGTFGSSTARVNVQRVIKMGYVQIPVMARYMTTPGKVAKFFVAAGIQFGIRTSSYEQVKIAGHVYLPDSLNFTADQKLQKYDLGLVLQFGTDLYATDHLYFEFGISGYEGLYDINGTGLQKLGWYDKNHITYQESHNAFAGLMAGVHYIFGRGRVY